MPVLPAVCLALFALALGGCESPRAEASAAPAPGFEIDPAFAETAVFGGGCFWCMEPPFERLPGVASVVSGFTGGRTANPTYDQVGRGGTGHIEVVQVTYDPRRISYEALLRTFWHNIDPVDGGGQFCDRGETYRPALFVTAAQRPAALASHRALAAEARTRFGRPLDVVVRPAAPFYPAEAYHQDFYRTNPARYRSYRQGCGRDARLRALWGDLAGVAGDRL